MDDIIDYVSGKRYITFSNALTRASHGLTLGEKRLVAIAASTLDSKAPLKENYVYITKINAVEYAETFGVSAVTAYEQLKLASRNLYARSVTFYEPAHKRNGTPIKPTLVKMRWIGEAHYKDGEGWIELHWWPAIMKHLVGVKRQFTSYQLEQAGALRSNYSWKLLELLMRFKKNGWAQYTIEDFCVSMEVTEKTQANFAKIRTKVIEPAIKELTDKDGWEIKWEPVRQGKRKVTGVRFEFKRNQQGSLDL